MNIHIYPKEELLAAWNRDKEHFQPDAVTPPRCLRCGQPLDRHFPVNALSRALDVYICEACGTAEGLGDWAGKTIPLRVWHAVANGRLQPVEKSDSDIVTLTPQCSFSHVFDGPKKVPPHSALPCPVSELVYSRADYDGRRWWMNWFLCQREPVTPELVPEIDAFSDALMKLPELQTLRSLTRACKLYAEPTTEPTEFNLYGETEHFYIWQRLITREKDYNLYCHFYEKAATPTNAAQ